MDRLDFFLQIIHQDVLAEINRRCEVRLPSADLSDLLDEVDEVIIAGEHEGIDEDARFAAGRHFFERLL